MTDQEKLLEGVVGAVEASSFERQSLWKNAREQGKRWEESGWGIGVTVGKLDDRPVAIALRTDTVDGQRILFVEPTSVVVDHDMIREWLKNNLPPSAFWPDRKLNFAYAENFHNVFRSPL